MMYPMYGTKNFRKHNYEPNFLFSHASDLTYEQIQMTHDKYCTLYLMNTITMYKIFLVTIGTKSAIADEQNLHEY